MRRTFAPKAAKNLVATGPFKVRNRKFESVFLRQRVRHSGVPRTLSAKVAGCGAGPGLVFEIFKIELLKFAA